MSLKVSRGIVYMAGSALAFSAMSMLVKITSTRLPTGEIVLARAVVTLVVSWAMLRRAGLYPWGTNKPALILRGVFGFVALTTYFISLVHLPLADATTIQNTTPLLTALLAWWILGERVGWSTAIAIACGIGGVTLIVHPGAAGLEPIGAGIALTSATFLAIAHVTVRQLARTEKPLVIVFYFPLIATPLALPWAIATWVTPEPLDWLLLVLIGLTTQAGQVLLTMGLTIERVGRASSVGYIQVAFAMLWQWAVFADAPTMWTIAGATLIIAGTLAVASVSAVGTKTRGSPTPPARPR